jgi:thiamine-phosphate pyrophosphorylase
MRLCAVTDRRLLPTAAQFLALVEAWVAGGVDFIQLREKDLDAPQLQALAREIAAKTIRTPSKLLVNISAPESAGLVVAAGADGVHLAGKPAPGALRSARQAFRAAGRDPLVSVPCHSLEDIDLAVKEGADLLLFSPIFEKVSGSGVFPPQELEGLSRACAAAQGIPVLALGGVTSATAPQCVAAGAAGVAGIRLFAGKDWRRLRPAS